MSHVVGIDLSTRAIDLVKLAENDNTAEWVRCELAGATAWDRTVGVHGALIGSSLTRYFNWFEDVYLVAIEAPYGRGQAGTLASLNRVVGAIVSALPVALRDPARCWIVAPHEWKAGLGLKGKPTVPEFRELAGGHPGTVWGNANPDAKTWQNAMDAYCLAMWARDTNARAVAAALGETA